MAKPSRWMAKARAGMKKRGTEGSLRAKDPTPGDKGLSESDLRTLWARAQRSGDTALKRKVIFAANARKPPVKLSSGKKGK